MAANRRYLPQPRHIPVVHLRFIQRQAVDLQPLALGQGSAWSLLSTRLSRSPHPDRDALVHLFRKRRHYHEAYCAGTRTAVRGCSSRLRRGSRIGDAGAGVPCASRHRDRRDRCWRVVAQPTPLVFGQSPERMPRCGQRRGGVFYGAFEKVAGCLNRGLRGQRTAGTARSGDAECWHLALNAPVADAATKTSASLQLRVQVVVHYNDLAPFCCA